MTSLLTFAAVSNTTYRIVLDGFGGLTGISVLNWRQSFAPFIVQSPEGTNVVANVNENAEFSVGACGAAPLHYQWRYRGTNASDTTADIANATNTTYTITNVQTNHVGSYSVVVTNSSGSATSAVAALVVHGDSAARQTLWAYNGGAFRFHIFGLTNRAYRIETSTNLSSATNWYPIYTNTVSYWYTNAAASNSPQRFYRAVTN